MEVSTADAIGHGNARHPGLRPNGLVAHVDIATDGVYRFFEVRSIGVTIYHDAFPAHPAEEIVERHPRHLRLDVPERHVDRGDRPHRHRPAAPVSATIEILSDVLDP